MSVQRGGTALLAGLFVALGLAILACTVGDLDVIGKTCTGTVCPGGVPCVNGRCSLEGPPDAAADACAAPDDDTCHWLPMYTRTQTVDGYADDFCGVPTFVLIPANENIAGPDTVNPGLQLQATVQAAWSADALHVFVHVPKWPIYPQLQYMIYEGDAVEICAAASWADVTGSDQGDPGTTHIIAAPIRPDGGDAEGGIALIYGTNTPLDTRPLAPPMEFASRVEEGVGYDVELRIPWASLDAGAPGAGSQVGFDVGLDMALPDDAGVPTWYQAFHSVIPLPPNTQSSSGCGGGAAYPGCDDRTWCRPSLRDQ